MTAHFDAPAPTTEPGIADPSRRDALRKLAIGGAIAWSAPLIASTAHAAGPTSCEGAEIDFNDYAVGDTFTSATVNGITMTLGPSSFFGGSAARATNRTIIGSPIGGIDSKGLRLEQDAVNGGGQEISLTFSQAVYNVTFVITDIDNSPNTSGWSDRIIIVTPTVYSYAVPTGSTVVGAGTATGTTNTTGPFRNTENFNYLNPSNGGNVTVTFPGPLTTFTLRFQCAARAGSNQLINLSNISFCG